MLHSLNSVTLLLAAALLLYEANAQWDDLLQPQLNTNPTNLWVQNRGSNPFAGTAYNGLYGDQPSVGSSRPYGQMETAPVEDLQQKLFPTNPKFPSSLFQDEPVSPQLPQETTDTGPQDSALNGLYGDPESKQSPQDRDPSPSQTTAEPQTFEVPKPTNENTEKDDQQRIPSSSEADKNPVEATAMQNQIPSERNPEQNEERKPEKVDASSLPQKPDENADGSSDDTNRLRNDENSLGKPSAPNDETGVPPLKVSDEEEETKPKEVQLKTAHETAYRPESKSPKKNTQNSDPLQWLLLPNQGKTRNNDRETDSSTNPHVQKKPSGDDGNNQQGAADKDLFRTKPFPISARNKSMPTDNIHRTGANSVTTTTREPKITTKGNRVTRAMATTQPQKLRITTATTSSTTTSTTTTTVDTTTSTSTTTTAPTTTTTTSTTTTCSTTTTSTTTTTNTTTATSTTTSTPATSTKTSTTTKIGTTTSTATSSTTPTTITTTTITTTTTKRTSTVTTSTTTKTTTTTTKRKPTITSTITTITKPITTTASLRTKSRSISTTIKPKTTITTSLKFTTMTKSTTTKKKSTEAITKTSVTTSSTVMTRTSTSKTSTTKTITTTSTTNLPKMLTVKHISPQHDFNFM